MRGDLDWPDWPDWPDWLVAQQTDHNSPVFPPHLFRAQSPGPARRLDCVLLFPSFHLLESISTSQILDSCLQNCLTCQRPGTENRNVEISWVANGGPDPETESLNLGESANPTKSNKSHKSSPKLDVRSERQDLRSTLSLQPGVNSHSFSFPPPPSISTNSTSAISCP